MLRIHIRIIITMLALTLLASCSDDDSYVPEPPLPKITMIASVGGMGDNGYNDLIFDGIMNFANVNDVRLSIVTPGDKDDAMKTVERWCSEDRGEEKSLLILTTNEYESLLDKIPHDLGTTRNVLLFESERENLSPGVYTFNIRRYGASYLSGRMASECQTACVISAYDDDFILKTSAEGFKKGYEKDTRNKAELIYLADDPSGFNKPEKAYAVTKELPWGTFVFPLAGGSNNGIYKYAREEMFTGMLVAGMDVDCSGYSTRTPFSLMINIDRVINTFLENWIAGNNMPQHQEYGFEDGYAGISVNKDFFDNCILWQDFYEDPDYWQKRYDRYCQEALQAERDYYAK